MTSAEQAAFRRLEKRHEALRTALRVIDTWLMSPWCATGPEDMNRRIAELVTEHLAEDEAAERKEQERQRHERP